MGPLAVLGIVLAASMAVGSLVALNGYMADSEVTSVQADEMRTDKNHEQLELISDGSSITITNLGHKKSKVLELRDFNDSSLRYVSSATVTPGKSTIITEAESGLDFSNKIYAITGFGNKFVAEQPDINNSTATNDGQSMIDGMGIQSKIIQIRPPEGWAYHGNGITGTVESIRSHVSINRNSDFAAFVADDDRKIALYVPEFGTKYVYSGGTLQEDPVVLPNILGYQSVRNLGTSTGIGSDGIVVWGSDGEQSVLVLNDYSDQDMVIKVTGEGNVQLLKSTRYDLTTHDHLYNHGFELSTHTISSFTTHTSPNPSFHVESENRGCTHYLLDAPSEDQGDLEFDYAEEISHNNYKSYFSHEYFTSEGEKVIHYCSHSKPPRSPNFHAYHHWDSQGLYTPIITGLSTYATIGSGMSMLYNSTNNITGTYNGVNSGDYFLINNISNATPPVHGTNPGVLAIYDSSPGDVYFDITSGTYSHTFPSSNNDLYMIVNPSGAITVKGEDPTLSPILEITGLEPNIAYELKIDRKLFLGGVTSSDGSIILTGNDVELNGSLTDAYLYLYTDSLSHRGNFDSVAFDALNNGSIPINGTRNEIYQIHAYGYIPVTGNVNISNLRLDETTYIPYLDGDYVDGDVIHVPIIPNFSTINMEINGIATSLKYANILGISGIMVASPATSTIDVYDPDSQILSATAIAGTTAYNIATADGIMNARISQTISGTVEITNIYRLAYQPPLPPALTESNPLTGNIDVFVNGNLRKSITFGINPNYDFTYTNERETIVHTSGGEVLGYSYKITRGITYSYLDHMLTGNVVIPVSAGDFVEFYMYAKINGTIDRYNPPPEFAMTKSRGTSSATANIVFADIISS